MSSILRTIFAQAEGNGHQKPYVGDTKTSAIGVDHYGWLKCDGRQLSKNTYGLLFNVIGYTFGGSGNTFNLPDPKGRVVGYIGTGQGLTPRTPGTNVGAETETLDISEMPAHDHGGITGTSGEHTHSITDPGHTHNVTNTVQKTSNNTPGSLDTTANEIDNINTTTTTTTSSTTGITINAAGDHSHTIASQGGGQPFSNMQPTLFFGNMFIYSGNRYGGVLANVGGDSLPPY